MTVLTDHPNIAVFGSEGAGVTSAVRYLKERFGYKEPDDGWTPGEEAPVVIDGVTSETDYWHLREEGYVLARVVTDPGIRAKRLGRKSTDGMHGVDPLAGLRADYLLFNQDTRDVLQNQIVELLYAEAAKK